MKIALLHPRLDHRGGAENIVLWMARGLAARGHELVVGTRKFDGAHWEASQWDGLDLVRIRRSRWDRLLTPRMRAMRFGHSLARSIGDCEVIVAHNFPAPYWGSVMRRAAPGTRLIWLCEEPPARAHWRTTQPSLAHAADHVGDFPWLADPLDRFLASRSRKKEVERAALYRRLEREALPHCDTILANSAFTASRASQVLGRDVLACPLGVPPLTAEAVPSSGEQDEPYVAWVTSPLIHKNAYGFLEAVRIAVHDLGAWDLRVRAVGLDGPEFHQLIDKHAIREQVVVESWLDDASLHRLIGGARLLAYPPIDEPFGLLPVEAMALSRAVLASKAGGPGETVLHGATGLLVDPLDPRDMAAGLLALWRDPERCAAFGRAGRQRYEEHYTFEHFLDRFTSLALAPAVS